jgi:hypothetical protein
MTLSLFARRLSLGKSSRERSDDVNVIGNTAHAHDFGADVTADCRQIGMHAWPHASFEPRLAILRAKNDVKNNFAKRLGHCLDDVLNGHRSELRFQRCCFFVSQILGRFPRLPVNTRLWR